MQGQKRYMPVVLGGLATLFRVMAEQKALCEEQKDTVDQLWTPPAHWSGTCLCCRSNRN